MKSLIKGNIAAATVRLSVVAVSSAIACMNAQAHPHIFAEARFDVVLEQKNVVALRHVWRFDDLFSATVIVEFDKSGDFKLDSDELRAVSDTIYESLAEFDYFQVVTKDGQDVEMKQPDELLAYYEGDQLVVLFEAEPREPLELAGNLSFGVYDPTFYTAIDFIEDEYMSSDGLPADCSRAVIRPDPDEAIAENQAALTEAFFADPTDYSKIFATRLEITCPEN